MKLTSIQIKNYRSIEDQTIEIFELDDKSYTYGLIGVNEAGKSSILKAIALKDGLTNSKGEKLPLRKDFRDRESPIEVTFKYKLAKSEVKLAKEKVSTVLNDQSIESLDIEEINIMLSWEHKDPSEFLYIFDFPKVSQPILNKDQVDTAIENFIFGKFHDTVFWTADERFLISKPITITQFAANPSQISIPLKNCFGLAGMTSTKEIKDRIDLISDSTEREQLANDLGEAVTDHINSIWKKHPIKITFDISDGQINFHVKDLYSKGKAKTADQRSDGFGQFISFLLTVSAQNKSQELANTILLIDEPETHLHPRAQEDLLKELTTITLNPRNNIVFFATHSNYMIDKDDLSRNYKISKENDLKSKKESTLIKRFDKKISTYASVTYDVFDIPSTDYHNELYSRLHEQYQDQDPNDGDRSKLKIFDAVFFHNEKKLKMDKPWKGHNNSSTLPTYIRNCIHHPEEKNLYNEEELRKSIELLESYV